MRRATPALRVSLLCAAVLVPAAASPPAQSFVPGPAHSVAPGVSLYHISDPAHLNPPALLSAWLLRIDLTAVDLRAALANDEIVDTETVAETASRHRAIAAVNAGFFVLPTGDPAGIYKIAGQLVSETRRARGAVGIIRDGPLPRLIFDRVTATMTLRIHRPRRPDADADAGATQPGRS